MKNLESDFQGTAAKFNYIQTKCFGRGIFLKKNILCDETTVGLLSRQRSLKSWKAAGNELPEIIYKQSL